MPSSDTTTRTSAAGRRRRRVLEMPEGTLRGVPLPTLLRGGARLFADGGQAAKRDPAGTYMMSRPVKSLAFFASHSWSCPRWLKFVALLVHFNLDAAVAVVAVLHAALFMLELLFHDSALLAPLMLPQPLMGNLAVGAGSAFETTTLCQTLGPISFWLTLCTAHHFRKPPSVFLDICCIAQDSDEAKARGIASLGAILDRSERMLALVSSDYFSRLWCVFEYAAFHQRAGPGRIDLIPMCKALSTLGFVVSFTIYYVVYNVVAFGGFGGSISFSTTQCGTAGCRITSLHSAWRLHLYLDYFF